MSNKVIFNPVGLSSYPQMLKELPTCNWKLMKTGKVPFNPTTGNKARTNDAKSFGTFDKALMAQGYDGIGVLVSHNVGCIDIDDCVILDPDYDVVNCISDDRADYNVVNYISDDRADYDVVNYISDDRADYDVVNYISEECVVVDERAVGVMELLPEALVEFSPSGTGLHLWFEMEDGVTYDTGRFYINNPKKHIECYCAGITKKFVTMTGIIFRKGSMKPVTQEKLDAFLEKFMLRHTIAPTKKGDKSGEKSGDKSGDGKDDKKASERRVLTDSQVLAKAMGDASPANGYNAKTKGEVFTLLYSGDWESLKPGDEDWTQNNADLSLCRRLAFWCQGNEEQMDRIFRNSNLMRDKWDQLRGSTTYGQNTIAMAVDGCDAFYDPGFDNDDKASEIDAMLTLNNWDIDTALADQTLSLAAWAKNNDFARYCKMKEKVPKSVGVQNFERRIRSVKSDTSHILLAGTSLTIPEGWDMNESGIYVNNSQGTYMISSEPVFVSGKLINVDDGTERLEIRFRRNGTYKTITAPRADMMNKNAIIRYADEGLPVASHNSASLSKFIAEFESVNDIPIKRCTRRAGWVGDDEFFPYVTKSNIILQGDGSESEKLLEALKTHGSEEAWVNIAAKMRTSPGARTMLAASFASVLVYPLQHRNLYLHTWCDSRGAKTASLKMAMSVWGDPETLIGNYCTTLVALERKAGTLKHLPLAIDELQTLNQKKLSVNDIVYLLGNGHGRGRGKLGPGIQKVETWKNVILSTGEMPMSSDNSMDGIHTRLMELNWRPLASSTASSTTDTVGEEESVAKSMHRISENNYGFAGKKFVDYVINIHSHLSNDNESLSNDHSLDNDSSRLSNVHSLNNDYNRFVEELACSNPHADDVAVIALGDYYSSLAIFGLEESVAFDEAVTLGKAILENLEENKGKDTVDAAWDYVTGWVAANQNKIEGIYDLDRPPQTIIGKKDGDKLYIIGSEFNKALDTAGFSYKKSTKGFMERGYIESFGVKDGRPVLQKRIRFGKSIQSWCYSLNFSSAKLDSIEQGWESIDDTDDDLPFN